MNAPPDGPSAARPLASLAGFGALNAAAALSGLRYSVRGLWYRTLRKPSFQPPAFVFGPVWTILYALDAYSGWRVFRRRGIPGGRRALALYGLQLGLNAAWSWLFFGRHRVRLALADILALDAALAAYLLAARRVDRRAAWAVAPYLAWTGFATALNARITMLNPRRR